MKTLLLKSNSLIKPSIVLVAAVLTAASLLAPFARADTAYKMPTGPGGGLADDGIQPFDPNPAAPDSRTRKFMTYSVDSDGTAVPKKTLRITNNTAQTVYPILRDPNSITIKDETKGLYDPYDDPNREYRGYIGYEQGGKFYFGLKKGESILVSVPLVFWNAARIGIGTDGQYLAPTGKPNPLRYDPNSRRSIVKAETSDDTIPNGVVMWYRADTAEAPNDDTEDQLAEWTIRDHGYLVNPNITAKSNGEIPDNQLVTLINYDVSNVDNLYLPLAMEANDVWVVPQGAGTGDIPNRSGWMAGSVPDVYGWTGAIDRIQFLQTKIREFTADTNKELGKYFGGKGWPFYNIPNPTNDPDAPIKIPSGANVFAQSPLKAVPSSYGNGDEKNDKYMLSSGGTAQIKTTIGWAGGTPDPVGSTTLHLNLAERDKIAFIEKKYIVTGRPPCLPNSTPSPDGKKDCERLANPIQDGTTVTDVDKTAGTVTLSKPLVSPSEACAFTFARPVDDYASEAMIKLWYSWAQYYLAHWKDRTPNAPAAPTQILGSIDKTLATLSFKEEHPELVEGMAVTGPGLDNAQTEKDRHQGDAVILKIATDKKSVILSQVANTDSTDKPFTFHPPQPFCTGGRETGCLLWAPTVKGDPGYPLIGDQFEFSNEPDCTATSPKRNSAECRHDPYDFSQQVYLIMASMNQIGKANNDSVSKFMQDIVGANMGFIFNNEAKKVFDAQESIAMIRDMIKSVLRGVSNFTKFPDIVGDHNNHTSWYPNPREPQGGQPFNVFNLDPFVWFVHVQLGFSGYGFSVDDDTADVGAGGASQLQLSVTGTGGLKNTKPWTQQAPYGPVTADALTYSGRATSTIATDGTQTGNGDTVYHEIKSVSNTTPIRIRTSGQHNLSDGDTVVIDQVKGDNAALGIFKIGNVARYTFDLFDAVMGKTPIAPSGNYTGGGRWSYPFHPYVDTGADLTKVFHRVKGDEPDGTFLGAFVSVDGVDRNRDGKRFRVFHLGQEDTGRLLLDADLTKADGTDLPAGKYNFTFFGVAETGTGLGGGPPPVAPPPDLGPIRQELRHDIHEVRNELNHFQELHGGEAQKARVRRLLEVRLSVFQARLLYPTDDVLEQLENTLEQRQFLGRKAMRRFLDQLNTRLVELQSGG